LNYSAGADAAVALAEHAGLLRDGGRRDEAEQCCRWSIDRLDELVRRDPWNLEVRRNLAMADGFLASILLEVGEDEGARTAFLEGRGVLEEISAAEPSDRTIQVDLYQGDGTFGAACLAAAGASGVESSLRVLRAREAESWLASAVAGLRGLEAEGASSPSSRWRQARFEAALLRCKESRNP
jgi:hypothetical protein